jgi:hypothetical protein
MFCQFSFPLADSYIENADIPQQCEGRESLSGRWYNAIMRDVNQTGLSHSLTFELADRQGCHVPGTE